MHPFVRQGSGGWRFRGSAVAASKGGMEHEKAGTAPSSGAGRMPAPPPTLCSGL